MTNRVQAYEEANRQRFQEYTDKINLAIDAIKKNKNYKATQQQVAVLTGIHRNTIRERLLGDKRLATIKREREIEKTLKKVQTKDEKKELENQLDNAKVELVHWFSMHQSIETELRQSEKEFLRQQEATKFYREQLEVIKADNKNKQVEIERLRDLLRGVE